MSKTMRGQLTFLSLESGGFHETVKRATRAHPPQPTDVGPGNRKEPARMTLYLGSHHPQHRPVGAHRKPTRFDRMKGWIRSPRPRKELR